MNKTREELDKLVGTTMYYVSEDSILEQRYEKNKVMISDYYNTFKCRSWRGELSSDGTIAKVRYFPKDNYNGISYSKAFTNKKEAISHIKGILQEVRESVTAELEAIDRAIKWCKV
jgi:hypothetical protein